MKLLVGFAFIAIVAALVSAGIFMLREGRDDKPRTGRMMHALAVRVALSVLLFGCILLAWRFGWINPTGIPLGR